MRGTAISGQNFLSSLQYTVLLAVVLYFGRPLLVPLSLAVLISFVLYPVCVWLEKKRMGRMGAILLSLHLLLVLATALALVLVWQLSEFWREWPAIHSKILAAIAAGSQWLTEEFGVSRAAQNEWLANFARQSSGDAMSLLRKTISASAVSAVLFVLIPIYAVLILYYRKRWFEVVVQFFPSVGADRVREILQLSIRAYYNFIKGMALVYLLVGILNSIGLLILGIPHAMLFGFVAAVLTFIPYVGILVGALLPISVAWITYNSVWYPLGVVAIFTVVQYLEANVIFPFAVSSRLNVNAFVTIVAIVLGGLVWGVAGMILFIPFLGIAKLIADRTPALATLALLLGAEERNIDPEG
jgi:predicted PurR-regulated permease PerM